MAGLVELIVDKYDGSLKAEHGTGINMAPYVEREWGQKATELMWRVKQLADPDGVLAPGVVLNRDPGVHLRDLKSTPPIEESATACVECGFCEPVCPSRNLTTTPRQRIVLRREMARQPAGLAGAAGAARGVRVRRARDLRGRRLLPARLPGRDRHRQAGQGTARRAEHAARRSAGRSRSASAGARSRRASGRACASARRWRGGPGAGSGLPGRPAGLPAPTAREPPRSTSLPAPTGSSAGSTRSRRWSRSRAAPGCRSGSPTTSPGSCCGLPWSSKGYGEAPPSGKANEMVERLWRWSGEGELPVVIDAASCTQASSTRRGSAERGERRALAKLEVLDSVAWAHDRLLPGSSISAKVGVGRGPPDLRDPPPGPGAAAAGARRVPSPTTSTSRPRRPAAASPATAASPIRS